MPYSVHYMGTGRMNDQHPTNVKTIFIDPPYSVYESDGLFNLTDPVLNRDGQLLPFHRLREHMALRGVSVHTADYLFKDGGQVNQQYELLRKAQRYSVNVFPKFSL